MFSKTSKRTLTFALAFALMFLMACVNDNAAGDNITWTFDASTGVLTLSGTGAMRDWDWENRAPWATHMHNNTTSIVISNGITTIGDTAFAGANRLTSVDIPPSVTHIGREAFRSATSLTEIRVAPGNMYYTDIDGVLFNYTVTELHTYPAGRDAERYAVPDSVTTVRAYAFMRASSLTSVDMPNVTYIGTRAFMWASSLTSVYMPNVTYIGQYAFSGASNLTSVYMPSVTEIGSSTFYYAAFSLTSLYMPSVRYVRGGAFA